MTVVHIEVDIGKCMHRQIMIIGMLALLFVLSANQTAAQIRYRVAGGLSTDWITSDNPAVYRLASSDTSTSPANEFGGALDGMQVGFGVRMYADLDAQKKFRIPVGVDVYTFSGVQAVNANTYKLRIRHDVDVFTGIVGFEYSFLEFPLAYARVFVGTEIRPLYVAPNNIITDEMYVGSDGSIESTVHKEYSGKPSAFRLGGMIRLGIEGEIYYPVFLNTSIGYGVMNLIGRDTRPTSEDGNGGRGELLTPRSINEATEQMLSHVNFTFMVQVRL